MKIKNMLLPILAASTFANAANAMMLTIALPQGFSDDTRMSININLDWEKKQSFHHDSVSFQNVRVIHFQDIMADFGIPLFAKVDGKLIQSSVIDFAIHDDKHEACHIKLYNAKTAVDIRWNENGKCIASVK